MKKWFMMCFCIGILGVLSVFGAGHIETLVAFDIEAGELTEGVAVDANGNVYVSLTPLGEIVKVEAGSDSAEPFGAVEGLMEDDLGVLGLAVDADGNVYGAVFSANEEANGVWKFDAMAGEGEHIAGTEAIQLANAIAFGDDGTMYVTDTIMGAVWSVAEDGTVETWIQDPLLEGDSSAGFPFPIGANGIDVEADTIYVGVLELATIVAIPIMSDGSAGEASVWAQLPEDHLVDGIVLDSEGNVIVAAPTINQVFQVDAEGNIDILADVDNGLDAPASVAYYVDEDDHAIIYAVNFSVAVAPPGGAGPALVKIDAGHHD